MWAIPEPDESEIENPRLARDEVIKNPLFKDMSDVELCLRFFAYRQIDSWLGSTMEVFLDEYLKKATTQFTDEDLQKLATLFNDTCEFVYELFGELAFCVHRKRNGIEIHYDKPAKVLYDPIMHVLSTMLDNKAVILQHKEKIFRGTKDLHLSNQVLFDGRKTTKKDVNNRFNLIKEFIEQFND